jgi:predicted dienelactone hydrolase
MPSRTLFALIALVCTLLAPLAATAEPFTAGERQLAATSPTAAVRNHGDPTLRLIVWYPATAAEQPVGMGPPLFIAGAAASNAAFADASRHPLALLSHGFGGSARQLTWLGAALARQPQEHRQLLRRRPRHAPRPDPRGDRGRGAGVLRSDARGQMTAIAATV